jgi:hypothetical protein
MTKGHGRRQWPLRDHVVSQCSRQVPAHAYQPNPDAPPDAFVVRDDYLARN